METSSKIDALQQSLRIFDRALTRPLLQRLGLKDITCLLRDIALFHRQAEEQLPEQPRPARFRTEQVKPEQIKLIAAGCRLSADLNEALISRLIDTLQHEDQTIMQLSAQLREHMQARAKTIRLLQQAQSLKHQTAETAEASGLGCIL